MKCSQTNFAALIGVTAATVSQYLTGQRNMGRSFCHRIEAALDLPAGSLDRPGMVAMPGSRLREVPAVDPKAADGTQWSPIANSTQGNAGSALKVAAISEFSRAFDSGAISDEDCAQFISELIARRVSHERANSEGRPASPASERKAGSVELLPGRLRLHEVLLLYVGTQEPEGLQSRLAAEFGEGAAQEVLRHLYDLRRAPLTDEVVEQLAKSLNHGIARW